MQIPLRVSLKKDPKQKPHHTTATKEGFRPEKRPNPPSVLLKTPAPTRERIQGRGGIQGGEFKCGRVENQKWVVAGCLEAETRQESPIPCQNGEVGGTEETNSKDNKQAYRTSS